MTPRPRSETKPSRTLSSLTFKRFRTRQKENSPPGCVIGGNCDKDPKMLIQSFWEAIQRRGTTFQEEIRCKYWPEDFKRLPKPQQRTVVAWCVQIPVLGFNSGRYDQKLIRKHFVMEILEGGDATVAESKVRSCFSPHQSQVFGHTPDRVLDAVRLV